MPKPTLLLFLFAALLASCSAPDGSPLRVEIKSPSSGASVSGTVAVQVQASDPSGIARVTLFARGKGSKAAGKELASSTIGEGDLYLVSSAAGVLPNLAELERMDGAADRSGPRPAPNPS